MTEAHLIPFGPELSALRVLSSFLSVFTSQVYSTWKNLSGPISQVPEIKHLVLSPLAAPPCWLILDRMFHRPS